MNDRVIGRGSWLCAKPTMTRRHGVDPQLITPPILSARLLHTLINIHHYRGKQGGTFTIVRDVLHTSKDACPARGGCYRVRCAAWPGPSVCVMWQSCAQLRCRSRRSYVCVGFRLGSHRPAETDMTEMQGTCTVQQANLCRSR